MFIHSLHFFTPLYYILTFLTHLNTAELPGTRTIHHSDACDGPICRGVESVLNRFWWAKWSQATFLIGFKPTTLNAMIHCKKVRSSGIHNVMAKHDMYTHHHPSISRAFPCACSVPGKWQNDSSFTPQNRDSSPLQVGSGEKWTDNLELEKKRIPNTVWHVWLLISWDGHACGYSQWI